LKDLYEKNEKTAPDIAVFQSMALLRAFTNFGRTAAQKEAQKISDQKDFSSKMKKPPHIFSASELYEMKDKVGTPYSQKYSNEFVTDFITKATARKEDEDLPSLVSVSADAKKEYFVDREMVSQVFLKKLVESSKEIKGKYIKEWGQVLKKYKTNKEMQSDKVYIESLNAVIKNDFKLFNALLNPDLIYLANKSYNQNKNIKSAVDACFSEPGKFKSIDKILNMDREELIKEVRASIPLHFSIPIIGRLIGFFISLLVRKEKEDTSAGNQKTSVDNEEVFQEFGSSSKEDKDFRQADSDRGKQSQDLLTSINSLKKKYLSSGKDMEHTLAELIEKWNYMVDKTARKHLTEDINSLIKDFLRSKKRLIVRYKTMDEERISTLADDLLRQMTNLKIKNRDAFRDYIELYMLKLLGNLKAL
jgi:hypothetical protein